MHSFLDLIYRCYWAFLMVRYRGCLHPAIRSRRLRYALTQTKAVHGMYEGLSRFEHYEVRLQAPSRLLHVSIHNHILFIFVANNLCYVDPTCMLIPLIDSTSDLLSDIAVAPVTRFTVDRSQYFRSHATVSTSYLLGLTNRNY